MICRGDLICLAHKEHLSILYQSRVWFGEGERTKKKRVKLIFGERVANCDLAML